MKVVITGGTGFIGQPLCRQLTYEGWQVTVLTRTTHRTDDGIASRINFVEWDGRTAGPWERVLEDADAVVNLAGEPIANGRWTRSRKALLRESRITATRLLVDAMARQQTKPVTLISASGIGWYGASDDRPLDEGAPHGEGFLADLCREWEAEAFQASMHGVRVVLLRTGLVLEDDGGALPRMSLPFRLWTGGPVQPGHQWVSWIHRDDEVRLIQWALRTSAIVGPLNAVAPSPVPMADFCRTLGEVLHRPSWLPVPSLALTLSLGEMATLMTTGQRVVPAKALAGGFVFRYPALAPALRAIYGQEGASPLVRAV